MISVFDNLVNDWANNPHVLGIVALSDLNQPYSCTHMGKYGHKLYSYDF